MSSMDDIQPFFPQGTAVGDPLTPTFLHSFVIMRSSKHSGVFLADQAMCAATRAAPLCFLLLNSTFPPIRVLVKTQLLHASESLADYTLVSSRRRALNGSFLGLYRMISYKRLSCLPWMAALQFHRCVF